MRCARSFFWPAIVAGGFTACDELPVTGPEHLDKLNLPIGRSWIYIDSLITICSDTTLTVRDVVVTAAGLDSLSPDLRGLLRMQITTQDGDSIIYSTIWYKHDAGGLWEVAYQNSEIVFAFPRVDNRAETRSFYFALSHSTPFLAAQNREVAMQSIVVRPEPRLAIKYPLRTGDEWIAFKTPFKRTMRCMREMPYTGPAGQFTVFKLQGLGDSSPAAHFEMYEYYSAEGLIRRELHWRDLRPYSPSGQTLPAPIDIDETIALADIVG